MQAVWTGMHALLVGIGVSLLGLLGAPTEAWLGAGTGMFALAAALICNAIYAHALQGQPRSDERATGDRRRAVTMLIALPVPIAFAVAAALTGQLRPAESVLHDSSVAAFVACLVVVAFALLYVSSTIDWYIVKAWRDGIVTDPPCKRQGNRPTWLLITRIWLLHRIVATIGFFVALWTSVGLGWFELIKHHGNSDWAIYLLGLVSPSAIPLFFMRSYIANLGHAVGLAFGNLRISLSDRVSWTDDGQHSEGIVYDVSIDEGYRVISHNGHSQNLQLARARNGNISIDETDPEPWGCDAVRASELMGASDYWAPRTHASTRGLILK
jgi:hypothetical protein